MELGSKITLSTNKGVFDASHPVFFTIDNRFAVKQFRKLKECQDELKVLLKAYALHLTPAVRPEILSDRDVTGLPYDARPHYYLVMQKYGTPLTKLLHNGPTATNKQLLQQVRRLIQIARAHNLDVDLHSGNVLVNASGTQCKLIDLQRMSRRTPTSPVHVKFNHYLVVNDSDAPYESINLATDPPTWVRHVKRDPGESIQAYIKRRMANKSPTEQLALQAYVRLQALRAQRRALYAAALKL